MNDCESELRSHTKGTTAVNVQAVKNYFVIFRGRGDRITYFSFFVDGRPSWTKKLLLARQYRGVEQAQHDIDQIHEKEHSQRT
jgi:hypothetical protein